MASADADSDNRRGLLVEPTPRALALVDEVVAEHVANERRLLSLLSRAEQDQLAGLLSKLLHGFEAVYPIPPPSGPGGRRRRAKETGRRH